MVRAGTYRESVKIQTDGLTLLAKGSVTLKPLKYGAGECYLPGHVAGFCVVPIDFDPSVGSYTKRVRDVTITGFRIVGFDDGVFGFGTENLKVSHVVAIDNIDYGVASFDGIGTRFTRNATSGSHDAGIYVGDSVDANAVVTNNRSWDNALGILVRHSHKVVVSHNKVWGNCLGVFLLSDIEAGGSGHITVQHNTVSANNNFCPDIRGVPARPRRRRHRPRRVTARHHLSQRRNRQPGQHAFFRRNRPDHQYVAKPGRVIRCIERQPCGFEQAERQ